MIKVTEAKQVGTLYHYTSLKHLLMILKSNVLRPWGEDFYKGSDNSFTRNKDFHRQYRVLQNPIQARITFDGDAMSERYKFTPYSDPNVADPEGDVGDGDINSWYKNLEQEEIVKGEIKNIRDYIVKIDIFSTALDNLQKQNHVWISLKHLIPYSNKLNYEIFDAEYLQGFIQRNYRIDCDILQIRRLDGDE